VVERVKIGEMREDLRIGLENVDRFGRRLINYTMKFDIERMISQFGSEEIALKFADIFREKAPEQLAALRHSFEKKDWEAVGLQAHGLKSQCAYMGLEEMVHLLQQLENNPQYPAAPRWLVAIEDGLQQ